MRNFFDQHGGDVFKGGFGMLASASGTAVSLLSQIETWLRISSLVVGLAVGVATFVSIVRKKKND